MPPYTTDPITMQGITAAKIGRRVDARRFLEMALSRDPGNVTAWWWLARVTDDAHASYQLREKCRSVAVASQSGIETYRLLLQEAGAPALRRYQLTPDSKSVNSSCPICTSSLGPGEVIIECPRCKTAHHVDCWEGSAYNCGGYACEGEGLVDHNAPPLFQPAADTATLTVDDKTIDEVAPYATRRQKEEGFLQRLMLANFRRQAELAAAAAAERRRQAVAADRARQVRQQQEEARIRREEAQRAAELAGRVTLAYFAGLIPGTIIAIAANAYFHDWLVFLFIVFLGATGLSTVAGHAYADLDTDRLTNILYWLFPKIAAALILYFSYRYWGTAWLSVVLGYLGGSFLVERILWMRALYQRRAFLTYSTIALLALFAFRYFSVNNP